MSRLPLIGVTFCSGQNGLHAYHISGDNYVHAAASAAEGLPVIVQFLADLPVPSDILDGLDDILFTGALSNIEPFHDSGPTNASVTAHDSARATTLSLVATLSRRAFVRSPCSGNLYQVTPMRQTTPDL
jgi:putative glutamine amidotransferase